MGISALSEKAIFMPEVIWPTCSHSNEEQQQNIIKEAIEYIDENVGDLINVCTVCAVQYVQRIHQKI